MRDELTKGQPPEQMGLEDTQETAEDKVRKAGGPLVQRIKKGHLALWERWHLIRQMKEGTGKDAFLKGWDEAQDVKLYPLWRELERKGYHFCLYTPPNEVPRYPCFVCPAKPFDQVKCPAWSLPLVDEEPSPA